MTTIHINETFTDRELKTTKKAPGLNTIHPQDKKSSNRDNEVPIIHV